MLDAIRSFKFMRGLGSSVIYYGCTTFIDQTQGVERFVYSAFGLSIISFAFDAILSIGVYLGILALCALWYFVGAKAGPWEGALLGVTTGIGIVCLNNLENEIRRAFYLPVEILPALPLAMLLWLPIVLLFALFGAVYARTVPGMPTHLRYLLNAKSR